MEVLTEFPVRVDGPRRGSVLKFLDGRIYRIVNGEDVFYKNLNALTNAFYIAANRRGLRVRIHVERRTDPIVAVVQAWRDNNATSA